MQSDPGDETVALLRVLIYKIDNTTFGDNSPTLPHWSGPPPTIVHVQAILFASLAVSLLSAFLAMLGKQWLNRYASTDMRGSAVERSQNRQRKLDGIVAWYFNYVMESLPLMLQAALLLLGCALSRYLWDISIVVASVAIGITSLGMAFYLFIIVAGAVFKNCPYQTPGSDALRHLGPKVWTVIHSAPSSIVSVRSSFTSALKDAFKRSRVIKAVLKNAEAHYPWWSRREIGPFLVALVLGLPRGFALDVYHLGRTAVRALSTLPDVVYRRARSANNQLYEVYLTLKERLGQQTIPSEFRCISWTLQTSLDKLVHLKALEYLGTVTEPTGLDPTLAVDCFKAFAGCVSRSSQKLVIMRGLETLATVSAGCFFHTLRHLLATDPASGALEDLLQSYRTDFPFETDFKGLPFYHTITMAHVLAYDCWDRCHFQHFQWDDYQPSDQEHILIARHMVKLAREKYQRMQQRKKVPRWILRFSLHSLALDPPSPTSVVSDCLTIIAIDLDCDFSKITTSDERCVQI